MPHSSGGGFHGGGFHGGGGFSGHHYGRGTSNVPLVSRFHYPGATAWLYYTSRGVPHIVYSSQDITKTPKSGGPFAYVLLGIFAVLPIAFIALAGQQHPARVGMNYDMTAIIKDNAGVLSASETFELQSVFNEFRSASGVTPSIVTVNNGDWEPGFLWHDFFPNEKYTLEDYAYSTYVNTFNDESHWLIVYACDKGTKKGNWAFEGMQGDNTDKLLTDKRADAFTESLHTRLLQRDKYSVDTAIAVTLDQYRPELMKVTLNSKLFYICLFMFVMFSLIAFYMFAVAYKPSKVPEIYKNAKLCELTAVYQEPCNYCGGIYIIGMHTTCPHCGAALPAHHYIKDAQGNVVELIQ